MLVTHWTVSSQVSQTQTGRWRRCIWLANAGSLSRHVGKYASRINGHVCVNHCVHVHTDKIWRQRQAGGSNYDVTYNVLWMTRMTWWCCNCCQSVTEVACGLAAADHVFRHAMTCIGLGRVVTTAALDVSVHQIVRYGVNRDAWKSTNALGCVTEVACGMTAAGVLRHAAGWIDGVQPFVSKDVAVHQIVPSGINTNASLPSNVHNEMLGLDGWYDIRGLRTISALCACLLFARHWLLSTTKTYGRVLFYELS